MAWFAVYRMSDGTLLSDGNTVADVLPPGTASKQFAQDAPRGNGGWDAVALAYKPAPAAVARTTSLDSIIAQPEIAGMTAAQKTSIRTAVTRVAPEIAGV